MGVKYLSYFMNTKPEFTETYRLHNTTVVIDGNNLACHLYFNIWDSCLYGGDYDTYAAEIKCYFGSFLQCGIKPIVIFDGGNDKSCRKWNTLITRAKRKIGDVEKLKNLRGNLKFQVLPLFAHTVFKDTLRKINIEHVQCSYEADAPLCSIANHYKCPLISLDSDFYIFDLPYGFIRTDTIDINVQVDKENSYCFLQSMIYKSSNLGVQQSILPLFATLLGNDFSDSSTFEEFFWTVVMKAAHNIQNMNLYRMDCLLSWLRQLNDINCAIEQVLRQLKEGERESVKKLIAKSVDSYTVSTVNFTNSSNEITVSLLLESCDNYGSSEMLTFKGNVLPSWLVKNLRQAQFSRYVQNTVELRKVILPIQVEDITQTNVHHCSLSIRRIWYGLLLTLDNVSEQDCSNNCIEEFRRKGIDIVSEFVQPVMCVAGFGPIPKLCETQISKKLGRRLILCTLEEIDNTCLKDLPDFYDLLVLSVRFWLRTCIPTPSKGFFDALLMTILFLSLKGKSENPETLFSKFPQLSLSPCKNATILELMSRVSGKSFRHHFFRNVKDYLPNKYITESNPFKASIVHWYSQFQSSLFYLLRLNELLNHPFEEPLLQHTLNGTLIYNLTIQFNKSDIFRCNILHIGSEPHILFRKLKKQILHGM